MGHHAIIKYCNRPFKNADEMDEYIIKKHNSIVGTNDTYICLGDFAFVNKDREKEYLNRLNAKNKILIRGNHDQGMYAMYDRGFDCVCESMVIQDMGIKFLLSHYPLSDKEIPLGIDLVIHGHVHRGKREDRIKSKESFDLSRKNMNISAEIIDYTPVNMKYILRNQEKLRLVNQLGAK